MKKKSLYITSLLVLVNVWTVQAGVQGALPGEFSVSASLKVHFAQGNLQYQASTKTWRFAANQYTSVGNPNSNISSSYSGWIDLFGWGTSGVNQKPFSGSEDYHDYPGSGGSLSTSINGSNYDWGRYNKISNGGNTTAQWRTLTSSEWKYLLKTRTNAANKLSFGKVNGIVGIILLPDSWTLPSGCSFTAASTYNSSNNNYTIAQWKLMEQAGAVFLPLTGYRHGNGISSYGTTSGVGHYWASTVSSVANYWLYAWHFSFYVYANDGRWQLVEASANPAYLMIKRYNGAAVRLVQNKNTYDATTYKITWKNWDGTTLATTSVAQGATPSYTGATPTRPSTAEYAYTFSGWTPAITAATANKTYTATYTATPRYTITFNASGGLIPTGGNMGNTPSGHITTLSADRASGTVVVTKDQQHFCAMVDDCPSREGYTFEGWYTGLTSGEQVYDETGCLVIGTYWNQEARWIGTSNLTLYARWKETKQTGLQQGALKGLFSISPNQKVLFSQGNLQYNIAGTHSCADGTIQRGTWRFARHQYDTIGVSQTQKSNTYPGWVSAFGWGTSGWNSGADIYQPWVCTGDNYQDYYPGGDSNSDLTGIYAFADWGVYNAIRNGGNQPQLWRTLSKDEWEYLLRTRPNAANLSSLAMVNGIQGCLFLPDDFILPTGMSFQPFASQASDNSYSLQEWTVLEDLGAVFIPRDYTYCFSDGNKGWSSGSRLLCYTSSSGSNRSAYGVDISLSFNHRWKCDGGAVRLVYDALPYTIIWKNADGSELEKDEKVFYSSMPEYGGEIPTKSADKEYTYSFSGWTPTITTVTGNQTYTATYTQTLREYTITVSSSNVSQGTAAGGGTYDYGTNHQITATPNECYQFTQWSDGNTDNPRTIIVNGDATYTAEFSSAQYTIKVESADESQGTVGVELVSTVGKEKDRIYYTSSDGNIVTPYSATVFGANIVSNTYQDGQGVIIFDSPVVSIGEYTFSGCSSLTSVTIPNSVTSIGNRAFEGCSSFTSVTIPNSVTSIGKYAFINCKSLTSINVDASNPNYSSIDDVLFNKDKTTLIQYAIGNARTEYTIPNSVTSIEDYAFYGCKSLTSVTIPNSVIRIEGLAFYNCSSLTSITIPNSVTSIGRSAFGGCSSLTSVSIGNSVTSIGGYAFYNCSSLTSVTIPNSVTSIGDYAFYYCKSLTSVHITDIEAWCKISFRDFGNPLSYAHNLYLNGELVKDLVIPDGMTSIGKYAFINCKSLTSVTIPNSVTSIGDDAFALCSSLISVTIPNSVTSIGFAAFESCSSLTSVTFEGLTPPIIGKSVFNNTNNCPIYVPYGTKDAYVAALNVNNTIDASRVIEK